MNAVDIKNLHVKLEDGKSILKGLNLQIAPGEVHAVMGPNGSGKSTLASVLAGRDGYVIDEGQAQFFDQDLLSLEPEVRATLGLFLAFQYPVSIPGVNNLVFLKTALNRVRKHRGESELDAMDFLEQVRALLPVIGFDEAFLHRNLNDGFSGGEKKRNEILQMMLLKPRLAILDEIDSGLDIDALQAVARGVNAMRDDQRSFLMITHYQRLLNVVKPDVVHVMVNGRIVESGDFSLAERLEAEGYASFTGETT